MKEKKSWTGERWEPRIQNQTAIEHLHRYAFAASFCAGKTVLDIACGEGYGSNLLAKEASAVTGVDTDAATINAAQKKYTAPNLRFISGDATKIPLEKELFDIVVSFETLEHLDHHEQMMRELKRVMKPGGQLIISTPDKNTYSLQSGYENPFHIKELNRDEFENLLKHFFSHVQLLTQEMTHCSLIRAAGISGFDHYSGNQNAIRKNEEPEALYLVALASDHPLPSLKGSTFSGKAIWQAALEEQASAFRNTISYRLGHLLLSPFKWFKKLFQ